MSEVENLMFFFLFSRVTTSKGEIRNNENCPNVTHGKKFWLEVMIYGLNAESIFTRPARPKSVNKHFIT